MTSANVVFRAPGHGVVGPLAIIGSHLPLVVTIWEW